MTSENIDCPKTLELASDLADQVVESRMGSERWTGRGTGKDLYYTEEAQDMFNEYYDMFLETIRSK